MKKICLIFISSFLISSFIAHCALYGKDRTDFEQVGDMLRYTPAVALVASLFLRDYEGAAQLVLGTAATQGTIESVKYMFDYANNVGVNFSFAKRPINNDYKGMPSGHAGGAMSAAGYVFFRYGWKPAIPAIVAGVLTAASRVEARKHSLLQVSVGSAIAWAWAFVSTTTYDPCSKVAITPMVGTDSRGGMHYGLNIAYAW